MTMASWVVPGQRLANELHRFHPAVILVKMFCLPRGGPDSNAAVVVQNAMLCNTFRALSINKNCID